MLKEILDLLIENKYDVAIVVIVIILFVILSLKNKNLLNKIIKESIKDVEKHCNNPKGQEKIDAVVKFLNKRVDALPRIPRFLAKHFVTKFWVVTTIEGTLNFVQKELNIDGPKIDIIGNESKDDLKISTTFEEKENNAKEIGITITKETKDNWPIGVNMERKTIIDKQSNYKTSDKELYASLKAETDFHSDPKIKAEIGIKKRF